MADLIISQKRRRFRNGITATSEAACGFTPFEFIRRPGAFMLGLCVGDREARADCQCGELVDRIATSAPVRKLLFVEALGDARVPFARYRPDHCAGVELTAIDADRTAEAAADLER
jgi:hypothetical protein